ncbi:hypothetical protein, partial [Candidatus Symbiothrix dinenymphae]|uniref:hypothetical protein n=1 Tax=Candidatus Symbiothrix dinenymphae TaxID=467085 RepID=UPI001D04C8A5
ESEDDYEFEYEWEYELALEDAGFEPGAFAQDETEMTINGNSITIHVNPVSGEYVAWLYPELYDIEPVKTSFHGTVYDRHERLDLRDAPVADDATMKKNMLTRGEQTDTIRYHKEWNYNYRAEPIYTLRQWVWNDEDETAGDFVDYFGEKEYVFADTTLMLVNLDLEPNDANFYTFDKPVFLQGKSYLFVLQANEYYVSDEKLTIEAHSVEDATFSITSTIAENSAPVTIALDAESGVGFYEFVVGAPSGDGPSRLSTTMTTGGRSYYSDDFGATGLEAYVLGGTSTGTDFRTTAPPKVDFVLHDPPGTSSYAYINAGTTLVHTEFDSWAKGTLITSKNTLSLGYSTMMVLGVVGTSASAYGTGGTGLETNQMSMDNGSTQTTYTFTQGFSTMGNPALMGAGAEVLVGDPGDLFVGQAVNTLFGKVNAVEISRTETFSNPDNIFTDRTQDFAIGKTSIMGVGESFETSFAYTEYEIENFVIPRWEDAVRGLLSRIVIPKIKNRTKEWNDSAMCAKLLSNYGIDVRNITAPLYVSHLRENHSKFGKLNSDTAFHERATAEGAPSGPSYTIIWDSTSLETMKKIDVPDLGPIEECPQDSVLMAYDQINGWLRILAQNEIAKLTGEYTQNLSFGAGVGSVGISTSHDTIYSFGSSSNRTHRVYVSAHEEGKVSGEFVSARRVAADGAVSSDAGGSALAAVSVQPVANRAVLHPGSRNGNGGNSKHSAIRSHIATRRPGTPRSQGYPNFYNATRRSHASKGSGSGSSSGSSTSSSSSSTRAPRIGQANFFWGLNSADGKPYMYHRTVAADGKVEMKRLSEAQSSYAQRDALGNFVKRLPNGDIMFCDVNGGLITMSSTDGHGNVDISHAEALPFRTVHTSSVNISRTAFNAWDAARPVGSMPADLYFDGMSAFANWRQRHPHAFAGDFFASNTYDKWNNRQRHGKAVATARKWRNDELKQKWKARVRRPNKQYEGWKSDIDIKKKPVQSGKRTVDKAFDIARKKRNQLIPVLFVEFPHPPKAKPKPKPKPTPKPPAPTPTPKPKKKVKVKRPALVTPTPTPTPPKPPTPPETTTETTTEETKETTEETKETTKETTEEPTKETTEDTTTEKPKHKSKPKPPPPKKRKKTPSPQQPVPTPPTPPSTETETEESEETKSEETKSEEPESEDSEETTEDPDPKSEDSETETPPTPDTPDSDEDEDEEEEEDDDDDETDSKSSKSSSLDSVHSSHFVPPKDDKRNAWDCIRDNDDGADVNPPPQTTSVSSHSEILLPAPPPNLSPSISPRRDPAP